MGLFRTYFRSDMDELVERNVRMRIIGHRGRVANDIQQMILDSESRTAQNTGLNLTFAFDYGSQEEIAAAARELARAAAEGRLDPGNHHAGAVRVPAFHQRPAGTGSGDPHLAVSGGCPISCSGNRPMRSFCSSTRSGPISAAPSLLKALQSFAGRDRRFGALNSEAVA